jgi:hypothetical protein
MGLLEDAQNPYLTLAEQATAPATPATGLGVFYFKSADSKPYAKNDAGTEYDLTASGAGGGATFIGARVYNSANIACASGAAVLLTFDSERYDTDSIHSTTANTGRLTVTTAGKYHITGQASFASNSTGARGLFVRLNGTTELAHVRQSAVGGTDITILNVSTTYDLAATDYVELLAYQTSGGSLNVTVLGNFSPEFMMHRLG